MITVMLENVGPDDVFLEVIDGNEQTHPSVFNGRLNSGEIAPIDVQEDDSDYANLTWHLKRVSDGALKVGSGKPGPGDTVEISK